MKKPLILLLMLFILAGCQKPVPEETPILSTPTSLRNDGFILLFDPVEHATSYILEVFGEEIELLDTSYVLGLYGTFEFRVKARAEGYTDSPYSDYYQFTATFDYNIIRLHYSVNSTFDLKLLDLDDDLEIVYVHSQTDTLTENDYYLDNNQLLLKSSFLKTSALGFHSIDLLLSNDISKKVHIYLTDSIHPYRVTQMSVLYEGEDVMVQFELLDGTVHSITHMMHGVLTEDDYEINGSFVTIKSSYIDNFFETHPSYDSISLAFDILRGDKFYLEQLFIDKIIE